MVTSQPTDRYVLEGRLVTMGPDGVIDDGAVYVDGGVIEAVLPAEAPIPDQKYAGAARIRTGDTLYPGLIELHNHLSYNAMPLWDVPQRYTNNGQWRGTEGYTREITKPTQVLGQTEGVVQALVRYVECRALFGGVTTSQGITLAQAGGITKYFRGLVRNVEQPLDPRLPSAGTNIANPDVGGAAGYLSTKLGKNTCYLQHLSEGRDDTARGWFLRLRIDGDDWAVSDVLCAIHGAALREEDFDVLSERGASMVWSPLSNYLLYGETADIVAAKKAGIRISLGSDWSPSGSKNLLGELKVASLVSREREDVFTPEELVAMVTVNPAASVKWDGLLGSIEQGKLADVVAVNGRDGDPYQHLIDARETSITLVVIGGTPRLGQKSLMERFWDDPIDEVPSTESFQVDRSSRWLYLDSPDEDLLDGLTLTAAVARLSDAMADLPRLAVEVDQAVALAGAGPGSFAGGMADSAGDVWRVVPDFEEEDFRLAVEAAARGEVFFGAEPYSFWVTEPMSLEPIAAAGDHGHFEQLAAARNLPEFIKEGLPARYGERIALPDSARFLETAGEPVADQVLATTQPLTVLLRSFGELSLADRKRIVDQALVLLTENYVHLPLKRSMHAVDPAQRLRLLRHRLDDTAEADMAPEIEFHAEVMDIFNSLRDLHTGYRLPRPFGTKVAWLPFLVEEIADRGKRRYIVTKWTAGAWPDPAMSGAELTHWNGMPIEHAVARNADNQAGSNPDARHARGLNALTIRPLARTLPPDEDWVTIRWLGPGGAAHDHTEEWLVFEPGTSSIVGAGDDRKEASALGIDDQTDAVQEGRKILYAPAVAAAEEASRRQHVANPIRDAVADLASHMPGVFRALRVRASNGAAPDAEYGYVRIFTFNVPDADSFVAEFVRLVEQLPQEGLVIDVRGNGGGLIYAAEQLLEVLTPGPIERERAQFITSPLNLAICRNHRRSTRFPGLDLEPWIASLEQSVETGATYSLGYPITPDDAVNKLGQRYFGPVVLVTDPLCYSATDMFAAGFQDHGIGPVIGVGGRTGAGGANVWSHGLLSALLEPDNEEVGASPYEPLPGGADMRVAIRRTTRVGARAGDILEDLGVVPDVVYRMTRRDVTSHNEDLIDCAIGLLVNRTPRSVRVSDVSRHRDRPPTVTIKTRNVTRVDVEVNGRRMASRDVIRNTLRVELGDVLGPKATGLATLLLLGYAGDALVARCREQIALT
jgi:imidazolonepropionase-like amidohydrolase